MRTIHRFRIHVVEGPFTIPAPWGDEPTTVTRIASVGDDQVEFWAVIPDEDAHLTTRDFGVVGTGHPIASDCRIVGTAGRTPGGLVWHLVEVAP